MKRTAQMLAAVACLLTATAPSLAAEAEEVELTEDEEMPDDEGASDESGDEEGEDAKESDSDDEEAAKSDDATADSSEDDSPVEKPGETYYFVGARYRGIIVPKFMINLFADGGRTVYVNSGGAEFVIREDGFEYDLGIWLGHYGMDPTALKGSSDGQEAWEMVQSKINVLFFTSDFLWSHPIDPMFSVNYGLGAGLGLVFGDLIREQTYPGGAPLSQPDKWTVCTDQRIPDPVFCDASNDHYNGYTEPSWFGGGSKPSLFPWLTLQTGLRFKPHRRFVGRLDLGFGTSGFWFGLGADYGL